MTEWQEEDVRGYKIGEELVCRKCISKQEGEEVSEKDLIVGESEKENFIFCDRCRSRI